MGGERHTEPGSEITRIAPGKARRLQTGMRGLLVVVACCAVMSWSARRVWETRHPVVAAVRGLQSDDPAERTRATRELMFEGVAEPGRAVPPLIGALADPERGVRIETVEALGAIGGDAVGGGSAGDAIRAAMSGLIRSLNDPEPVVRAAAVFALVRIAATRGMTGPIDMRPALDAIAAALTDRDDRVRQAAFDGLTICGPSCTASPPAALIAALGHSSAAHRAKAVKALASFGCDLDPWLPFLLRSLEHDEPDVRGACWSVFARERPPAFSAAAIPALVAALGSRARIVRARAAWALQPHAREPSAAIAIPVLLKLLKEPLDRDPGGLERPPGVAVGFGDGDPAVAAAHLLGQVAPRTTAPGDVALALADAVLSEDFERQHAAIEALGQLGPAAEPAIPALVRILREGLAVQGGSRFVDGYSAITALGRIAPGTNSADAAIAALSEALDSRSEATLHLRLAAIDTLRAFGKTAANAIPRLRACANDSDARVKAWATRTLEAIERRAHERRSGAVARRARVDSVGRPPARLRTSLATFVARSTAWGVRYAVGGDSWKARP